MVRSTYKMKKRCKKQNNRTIKIWGGSSQATFFQCPYCVNTFATIENVQAHCKEVHPTQPRPPITKIHAVMPAPVYRNDMRLIDRDRSAAAAAAIRRASAAAAAIRRASAAAAADAADAADELPTIFTDVVFEPFVVMVDPVVASDGFTYERKHIELWFGVDKLTMTSPTTGGVMDQRLIPNNTLKSEINQFNEGKDKFAAARRAGKN